MFHQKQWRPAADPDGWVRSSAAAVCAQLGCGSVVSTRRLEESSDRSVWWISFYCLQRTSVLRDCVIDDYDPATKDSLEVICSDSVRLVDGPHLCSGRLEVNFNQSWSSVCEADFDQQDAEVVCRELDCGPPSLLQGALYGEVEAPVWSREFQCEGTEAALLDCRSSGSARNTCSPGKAVGLTCSDLRLVGEASRCAGTLEMFHQKQWRPAADPDGWVRSSAAAVCAQLGCGSVVSTRRLEESSDRSVWWISFYCLQRTSVLRDCVIDDYDPATKDSLEVICSDLLVEPHIFLPSSTDEVSNAIKQGSEVPIGSDFSIMCSIKPQYQGGSFQLIFSSSNSAQNYTLPAVNHSAHFLFSAADHAHQGTYSCVYHVYVFSHNFSSPSQPLSVTVSVSGSLTALIIRLVVVLLGLMGSILVLYFYFKASSSQKWGQKKKPHVDGSRAEGCREEETAASRIFSSHSDEETVTCFRQLVAPHGDMREPEVI
uniref:Scavenger receptor cysteine-rich type 1 protein M160-like n=1 Tax=Kryptolebias marmoratus TaxID=37003 RepID=A0A3Q3ABB6_KRYMA